MNVANAFVDSNVILYLFTDDKKAVKAESVLEKEPVISVQVLNEVCNVLRRKSELSWRQTSQALELVRTLCRVDAVTVQTHEEGFRLAQRHSLSIYDAMIASAALLAECDTLYSEDMQHGLLIDRKLRIVNPFRTTAR